MKKTVFIIITVLAVSGAKAQITEHLTFAASIGTGVAMNAPAFTPFTWLVSGYYNLNERFSAGIGTGLSCYEKTLIPLFADVRFNIIKPRKFTPCLTYSGGYGFAPDKNTNGGIYLNPSFGLQYSIGGNKKLFLAAGYELQKFERLKKYESPYFEAEFEEQLSHNSLSLKIGFMF